MRYTVWPGAGMNVGLSDPGGTLTNYGPGTVYFSYSSQVSQADTPVAAGASTTVGGGAYVYVTKADARAEIDVTASAAVSTTVAPSYINFAGHSYFNTTIGVLDQSQRIDNVVQALFNIQKNAVTNRALAGATLLGEGGGSASYVTILQQVRRQLAGGPFTGHGGSYVNCWGINDIGKLIPSTDFPAKTVYAQVRAAFKHAYRAVISRQRAHVVYECGGTDTETNWVFSSFANGTSNTFNSGTGNRFATAVAATATFTIPSDFPGGTIAFGFSGSAGAFGGTASVGGTFSQTGAAAVVTSNTLPGGVNHGHICRRFTGLPATDAGKTIVFTVTAVDASGQFAVDYAQVEAVQNIPVVVLCNIARLLNAAAYTGYASSYWSNGSNNGASGDADVADFNAAIAEVRAEFDKYVVIADIDGAFGKIAANYGVDGIHPSPVGSPIAGAAIANAIKAAPLATANVAADWRGTMGLRAPRKTQNWYSPEVGGMVSTTVAVTTGQCFAMPMVVSEPTERWDGMGFEVTTAAAGTGGTVRLGLYDDEDWIGYPQMVLYDYGTKAITATGVQTLLTPTVNSPLDPGLYWLVLNMEAQGGTTPGALRAFTGQTRLMPWSAAGAAPAFGTATGNTAFLATGMAAGGLPSQFPLTATAIATAAPNLAIRRI